MNTLKLPCLDRLRELLHYDCKSGVFVWTKSTSNSGGIGSVAGSANSKGYISITVDKKAYKAHRLAWLYMTGNDPGSSEIDHIDRNKSNNSWGNLRLANRKQNNENIGVPANSTTGFRGVSFIKRVKRWAAYIYHNKRRYHLGYFGDIQSAVLVRRRAESEMFTHHQANGITGGSND